MTPSCGAFLIHRASPNAANRPASVHAIHQHTTMKTKLATITILAAFTALAEPVTNWVSNSAVRTVGGKTSNIKDPGWTTLSGVYHGTEGDKAIVRLCDSFQKREPRHHLTENRSANSQLRCDRWWHRSFGGKSSRRSRLHRKLPIRWLASRRRGELSRHARRQEQWWIRPRRAHRGASHHLQPHRREMKYGTFPKASGQGRSCLRINLLPGRVRLRVWRRSQWPGEPCSPIAGTHSTCARSRRPASHHGTTQRSPHLDLP